MDIHKSSDSDTPTTGRSLKGVHSEESLDTLEMAQYELCHYEGLDTQGDCAEPHAEPCTHRGLDTRSEIQALDSESDHHAGLDAETARFPLGSDGFDGESPESDASVSDPS